MRARALRSFLGGPLDGSGSRGARRVGCFYGVGLFLQGKKRTRVWLLMRVPKLVVCGVYSFYRWVFRGEPGCALLYGCRIGVGFVLGNQSVSFSQGALSELAENQGERLGVPCWGFAFFGKERGLFVSEGALVFLSAEQETRPFWRSHFET